MARQLARSCRVGQPNRSPTLESAVVGDELQPLDHGRVGTHSDPWPCQAGPPGRNHRHVRRGDSVRRVGFIARRADDLSADPAVALIEEPTESFDAWLHELLSNPPVELGPTGTHPVAQARADVLEAVFSWLWAGGGSGRLERQRRRPGGGQPNRSGGREVGRPVRPVSAAIAPMTVVVPAQLPW